MSRAKETINEVKQKLSEFVPVMDALSRARNPFELRYFVIGKHDDRIQQYKQAVVEMDAKYKAVLEGIHSQKLREIQRERLTLKLHLAPKDRLEELENDETNLEIMKLDRETHDTQIGMTGAFKEVMDFITIIENEYSDLIEKTEEELLKQEKEYWKKRFAKQVSIDLLQVGNRISEGNLSSLMMMPKEMQKEILIEAAVRKEETLMFQNNAARDAHILLSQSYPHKTTYIAPPDFIPMKLRKDAPEGYPEDRIANIDRAEFMIATLHRPGDKVWLTDRFYIPTGKNNVAHTLDCPNGDSIGEYRNCVVKSALSLGCEYLFFVDDDLVVDKGALQQLYKTMTDNNLDVVGGWYCKKTPVIESATMISIPGSASMQPVPLDATGLIEVDWSLTAGLTLIKTEVFKKIPYPWYMTIHQGTEDTYFSARCREVGIKSWLDTSVKAEHVDKSNGDAYGWNGIERGKYRNLIDPNYVHTS